MDEFWVSFDEGDEVIKVLLRVLLVIKKHVISKTQEGKLFVVFKDFKEAVPNISSQFTPGKL